LQICARCRYNPNLIESNLPARFWHVIDLIAKPGTPVTRRGGGMATCPECDAEIEVDEFDVDKGDQLSCPECGSNLEVASLTPLELELAPESDEEEEDEDEDLDDDDDLDGDDDDEEDEDEEDEGWEE
jgi:lysine biosynthesis protein LysW